MVRLPFRTHDLRDKKNCPPQLIFSTRASLSPPPPSLSLSDETHTPISTTQESHRPTSLRWFAISTARYGGSSSHQHHQQQHVQHHPLQKEEQARTWPPLMLSSKYTSPGRSPAPAAARSCARCLVANPWKHGQSRSLEGAKETTSSPRKKVNSGVQRYVWCAPSLQFSNARTLKGRIDYQESEVRTNAPGFTYIGLCTKAASTEKNWL